VNELVDSDEMTFRYVKPKSISNLLNMMQN